MDGTEADSDILAICHCAAMKPLFLVDTTTGLVVRQLAEGVTYVDPAPECDPATSKWATAGDNKQIIYGFSCPNREVMQDYGGADNLIEEVLAIAQGKPGWSSPDARAHNTPILRVGGKVIFPTYSMLKESVNVRSIKLSGTRELKMPPYVPNRQGPPELIPVPNTTWTVEYDVNPRFILVTGAMISDGKLKKSDAIPYFPAFPVLVFTYHGARAGRRKTRKSKRRARKTRRRV